MNNSLHIAIIILNWNGVQDTVECVESIQSSYYDNTSIIVVDNNSRGDDVEQLQDKFGNEVTIIANSENLGFAEGNNVGIRWAVKNTTADYLHLLNNDTILPEDSLTHLISTAENYEDTAVFGPAITYNDDRDIVWSAGLTYENKLKPSIQRYQGQSLSEIPDSPYEVDKVIGAAFLIPIEPLLEVGLLDPDFFLYHEESEWCHRAREKGFECRIVPSSRVYHKVSQSATTSGKIPSYYHPRNKILLAYKTEPLYLALPIALILAWRDIIGTTMNYTDWEVLTVLIGVYDGLLKNNPRIIPD